MNRISTQSDEDDSLWLLAGAVVVAGIGAITGLVVAVVHLAQWASQSPLP